MARAIVAILLLGLGTRTTAGDAPTVSAKGSDLVLNPGSPNGQTIIQDSEGKATLTSSMINGMATMSQVQSAMKTKLESYVLSSQLPGSPADIATMDKVESLLRDYTPPTPDNVITESNMIAYVTDYVQPVSDDLDVLKTDVERLQNSPPPPPSGGGGADMVRPAPHGLVPRAPPPSALSASNHRSRGCAQAPTLLYWSCSFVHGATALHM